MYATCVDVNVHKKEQLNQTKVKKKLQKAISWV
jgi:hypothetical protein